MHCPDGSNPLDFARHGEELRTEDWLRVFREARDMGAAQLGFSGGEPLLAEALYRAWTVLRNHPYHRE